MESGKRISGPEVRDMLCQLRISASYGSIAQISPIPKHIDSAVESQAVCADGLYRGRREPGSAEVIPRLDRAAEPRNRHPRERVGYLAQRR